LNKNLPKVKIIKYFKYFKIKPFNWFFIFEYTQHFLIYLLTLAFFIQKRLVWLFFCYNFNNLDFNESSLPRIIIFLLSNLTDIIIYCKQLLTLSFHSAFYYKELKRAKFSFKIKKLSFRFSPIKLLTSKRVWVKMYGKRM